MSISFNIFISKISYSVFNSFIIVICIICEIFILLFSFFVIYLIYEFFKNFNSSLFIKKLISFKKYFAKKQIYFFSIIYLIIINTIFNLSVKYFNILFIIFIEKLFQNIFYKKDFISSFVIYLSIILEIKFQIIFYCYYDEFYLQN